jgi:VWFA-related protein
MAMLSTGVLRLSRRFAVVGVLVLAGVPLAGQQQPVFRTGVDLVTVDVTVLDKSGTPIEGLGADEFEIRVDNASRRVIWAEFVRQELTRPTAADSRDRFDTNEGQNPGRLILVAVDQTHVRRIEGRAALRAAASFIDALDPADRVAAAPVTHGGAIQFTGDHASVKRYLQTLTGEASPVPAHFNVGLVEALAIADGSRTRLDQVVLRECGQLLGRYENPRRLAEGEGVRDPCPVQIEQESRAMAQMARTDARLSLDALLRLIARLAEIDGPKALVLISEGLVAEAQLVDLSALGAAAQAARVTIYVLQLEVPVFEAAESRPSPTFSADVQVRADGLARLAASARGALFHLVGADPYPFRRILAELSGYYLIAFEAADADRDGRTHRIDVSTRAAGATLRARPSFRIPAATTTASGDAAQLERLLRSPRLATELPLRLAAYTTRAPGRDGLRVLVTLETDATPGRAVTLGFVLVNDRGVVVSSGGGPTDTGRYLAPVELPAGRYRLKAAGIEPGGRQGSVERRFVAELAGAGDIRISDFILAEPSDVLIPSIVRTRADRIVAYLEIYAPPGWTPPEGLATIAITSPDSSAPLVSVPGQISAAGSGRWVLKTEVPLVDLPPGPYVASASLAIHGLAKDGLAHPFVVVRR